MSQILTSPDAGSFDHHQLVVSKARVVVEKTQGGWESGGNYGGSYLPQVHDSNENGRSSDGDLQN